MPEQKKRQAIKSLTDTEATELLYDWEYRARAKQLPPDWDWYVWLLLSGRGGGKTRTGSELVNKWAREGYSPIALVGQTKADVRDTMVEVGDSSILKISPPWFMPEYEPSKRRITWPNGVLGIIYSGDEPDQLRGPQHAKAYVDEIAKFKYPQDTWDNLMFGLRIGGKPQVVCTTTPRPIKIIKDLVADPTTAVTRGHTLENKDNLSGVFIKHILAKYEGTRLGRQELAGEILDDNPSALWARDDIDNLRVSNYPELTRIVVAVDPQGTDNNESSETGIIVAGVAKVNGIMHGYILADLTLSASPEKWSSAVVAGYHTFKADCIVGEVNFGGDMVESIIKMNDRNLPFHKVHASRGKAIRAEPVSALYEQCVAQGTMISTMLGDIPVEDIRSGDYVWTRDGLRRVSWTDETGIKPTLRLITDVGELTCTENHPVHTADRGFILAGQLVPKCDILTVWNYLNVQIAESVHQGKVGIAGHVQPRNGGKHGSLNDLMLHSMASDITSKRMGIGEPVDIQEINYYIERYGNQCMALSLKGGISTMTMETQAIMNLKILSLFRRQSIVQNTYLIQHLPMELLLGCRRPERTGGNAASHNLTSAKSVGASSRRRRHGCDSAPQPVTHGIGVGAVEKGPNLPVYNLTVEGVPEYFANGILVHNCRIHHVGFFAELEDQLCEWCPGDKSPDRLDALVWSICELILRDEGKEFMVG